MLRKGTGLPLSRLTPSPVRAGSTGKIQPVIVHASVDTQGKVAEAEMLQNSDPSLSNGALSVIKNSTYPPQTRATGPVQTEALINVEFGAAR